jgi:CBS domain-containing protein
MSTPARGVVVGGDAAFAEGVVAALGVPVARLALDALDDERRLPERISPHGVAWLHLVPSAGAAAEDDPLAEAALLLRSARAAREAASRAGVPVTFVAVLPAPGIFAGAAGAACDLALTATTSLMRTEIGIWSDEGRRIVGVVYAGIEGNAPAGQRPLEEIRRRTPMTVLGTFAQLADALRYVASSRATYVTGTMLRVDGGCDAYSWVYPTRTI